MSANSSSERYQALTLLSSELISVLPVVKASTIKGQFDY